MITTTIIDGMVIPKNMKHGNWKAPEAMLGYTNLDYSYDMWSYGVMLAGWLLRRPSLLRDLDPKTNLNQLVSMAKVDRYIDRCLNG